MRYAAPWPIGKGTFLCGCRILQELPQASELNRELERAIEVDCDQRLLASGNTLTPFYLLVPKVMASVLLRSRMNRLG
jgi:hypothetical protein